jgi:hypothetical protein
MRVTFCSLIAAFIVLPIGAAEVVVQPVVVKLVPLARVHDACGSDREFDACTRFVAYELDASCDSRGALRVSATFRPMIFLYNIQQLTHEKLHIEDIRRFADAYVTDIEQKPFETESQCRDAATIAMDHFDATMQSFAVRSNLERHPLLRLAGR